MIGAQVLHYDGEQPFWDFRGRCTCNLGVAGCDAFATRDITINGSPDTSFKHLAEQYAIMPTCTWWIDEPLVRASTNPTDDDLAQFQLAALALQCRFWKRTNSLRDTNGESAEFGWSIYDHSTVDFALSVTAMP